MYHMYFSIDVALSSGLISLSVVGFLSEMDTKNESGLFEVRKVDLIPTKKRLTSSRNVFKRMEDHGKSKGPLGVLSRCVEQKLKVKVWTRGSCHIRGICTGYIVAFDKHWNLAMVDVDEVFINPLYNINEGNQAKNKNKSECTDSILDKNPNLDGGCLPNMTQKDLNNFHKQRIENRSDKLETSSNEKYLIRHIPQLFLRGDNVVLVVIND